MAVYAKPRDISAPKVRNGINDWYDGYIELGGELVRSTAIDGMAVHLFHVYNTAGIFYEAVDPLRYTNFKLDPNYWEVSAWGTSYEWSGYAMINATRNYEDHTYTNPDNGYIQGGIVSHWEVQGRDVDGYAFNFIQLRPGGIDFYLDAIVQADLTIRNIPVGSGTHLLLQDAAHKIHKATTASVLGGASQNGGNFIWNQNAAAQTANAWITGSMTFSSWGSERGRLWANQVGPGNPTAFYMGINALPDGTKDYGPQPAVVLALYAYDGLARNFEFTRDGVSLIKSTAQYTLDVNGTLHTAGQVIVGSAVNNWTNDQAKMTVHPDGYGTAFQVGHDGSAATVFHVLADGSTSAGGPNASTKITLSNTQNLAGGGVVFGHALWGTDFTIAAQAPLRLMPWGVNYSNLPVIIGNVANTGHKLQVDGAVYITTVANATVDPDKIVVWDGGVVKYMTKAQLGIGAVGSPTLNQYHIGVGGADNKMVSTGSGITWNGTQLGFPQSVYMMVQSATTSFWSMPSNATMDWRFGGGAAVGMSSYGLTAFNATFGGTVQIKGGDTEPDTWKATTLQLGYSTTGAYGYIQALNNGTPLWLQKTGGVVFLGTVANETVDPDKIMVWAADKSIRYMTKAQLGITGYWAASGDHVYNTNVGNVLIGTSTSASPDYKLQLSGSAYFYATRTLGASGGQVLHQSATWTYNGTAQANGSVWASNLTFMTAYMNASMSLNPGTINSANFIGLQIRSNTAATITVGQAGLRAMSVNGIQVQLPQTTVNTSIDHVAGIQIYGLYQDNGTTQSVSIGTYYALLLGRTRQHLQLLGNVTTAYAVYQEGNDDINYWAGKTEFNNDIEIMDSADGLIMTDTVLGTRHRVQLTNGAVTVSAAI